MLPLVVLGLRRRQSAALRANGSRLNSSCHEEQPTDIADLLAFIEMRHCAPGVLLGLRYTVATAKAHRGGGLSGMQPSVPSASPSDQTARTERVTGDDLSAPDFDRAASNAADAESSIAPRRSRPYLQSLARNEVIPPIFGSWLSGESRSRLPKGPVSFGRNLWPSLGRSSQL
jgi:hypothetical protein